MHLGSVLASLMKIQVVATSQEKAEFKIGIIQHRTLAIAIFEGNATAAEEASRRLVLKPYEQLSDMVGLPQDARLK